MASEKMRWTTPELIVLARGTPEESVLTHCKGIHLPNFDPDIIEQSNCSHLVVTDCGACQSRSGS
jgi:hypothetical protein